MKTVYFVRHGESKNNAIKHYNTPDTPLSVKGEEQAEIVGERCKKLPIEIIIASDMHRAQQTAKIISSQIQRDVETCAFFRERITATSILGKSRKDPSVMGAVTLSKQNFHTVGWRYEDGENFEDLKARALKGLAYLEERPEKEIVVVSHGFFMFIMAAVVMFGHELTSRECLHLVQGLGRLENTSLSVAKRNSDRRDGRSDWRLTVWNDHAHLG